LLIWILEGEGSALHFSFPNTEHTAKMDGANIDMDSVKNKMVR